MAHTTSPWIVKVIFIPHLFLYTTVNPFIILGHLPDNIDKHVVI